MVDVREVAKSLRLVGLTEVDEAADLIEQQSARIAEFERKERSTARLLCRHGYGKLCMDTAPTDGAAAGKEAVAWQVRRADGRIDGVPIQWENCTQELYDATLATGRYAGYENGPQCEVRALYTAPTAALEKGDGRDAWISVDERLPEERQVVLVFRPDAHLLPACDPNIDCRCYFGNGVFNGIHPVTHWMPLPAPPAALYQKANDGLSLRAQHEDACIAANNNAQDAERYRWLRTLDSDFGNRNRMSEMARFYGETLDEAIDAALSQKAGEQQ
jgi:hypothetical protein